MEEATNMKNACNCAITCCNKKEDKCTREEKNSSVPQKTEDILNSQTFSETEKYIVMAKNGYRLCNDGQWRCLGGFGGKPEDTRVYASEETAAHIATLMNADYAVVPEKTKLWKNGTGRTLLKKVGNLATIATFKLVDRLKSKIT